uniref:Uncharacterized protein n=1 Tax=Romanomermis culicivorax TaxID=13658 RepID=A0A915IRR3_ROMCU
MLNYNALNSRRSVVCAQMSGAQLSRRSVVWCSVVSAQLSALSCRLTTGCDFFSNPEFQSATDDEEKFRIYVQEGSQPPQNFSKNVCRVAGNPPPPPPDDPYLVVGGVDHNFSGKNAASSSILAAQNLENQQLQENFFGNGRKSTKNCFLSNNCKNQSYVNGRNCSNQVQTNSTVTPSLPIQKLIQLGLPKSSAKKFTNDDDDDNGDEKLRSYGEDKSLFVIDFNNDKSSSCFDENFPLTSTTTISKKTPVPNILPLIDPPQLRENNESPQQQLIASPLMQYCINLAIPKAKKMEKFLTLAEIPEFQIKSSILRDLEGFLSTFLGEDHKKSSHHQPFPNKTSKQRSPNFNTQRHQRQDPKSDVVGQSSESSCNLNNGYCNNDNIITSTTARDFETSSCSPNLNFSEKPNLQDSLMQISTSSNLIKTHTTLENIKDAANLTPAENFSPSKFEKKSSLPVVMYNSESFSEDNYSRKSEEEEFFENGDQSTKEIFDFTVMEENVEDETLTSELITITNLQIDELNYPSSKQAGTSCKPNQSSSEAPASPSSLNAPKLIVRSTKTVDLRLQAQASGCASSHNSRSGSPHSGGCEQSGVKLTRNIVERSPSSNLGPSASKICCATNRSPCGGAATSCIKISPRKSPAIAAAAKPALPPKPQKRGFGDRATPPPPILHPKPKNDAALSSKKTSASPSSLRSSSNDTSKSGQITTV